MKKTVLQFLLTVLLVAAVPFAYVVAAPYLRLGSLDSSTSLIQDSAASESYNDPSDPKDVPSPTDPGAPDVTGGATTAPTVDPNAPDVTGGATSNPGTDPNAPDVTGGATASYEDDDEDDVEDANGDDEDEVHEVETDDHEGEDETDD